MSPTFLRSERKKGNKGGKERLSKQKLLKGCHQGENVTVLAILERLEFKNFLAGRQYLSVFHGPSTLKSISPALTVIDFVFRNLFLNLDLFTLVLCSFFVMKGASLARTYFLLIGACLLNMPKTVSLKHFRFFSEVQF